jgi:lipoprotein-anchoring transpeptidase ErfK/SrfK
MSRAGQPDPADPPRSRHTALIVGLATIVVVGVVVAVVVTSASSSPRPRDSGHPTTTVVRHQVASAPTTVPGAVSASFLIATLSHDVPSYAAPGGAVTGTVASTWYGESSALPVVAQQSGYLEVRLQQRPNGSTAWIRSSGATLSSSPYCIVIHLRTMHLDLYDRGKLVLDAPAGIGTAQYPTPTGNFFVAFLASPPSPGYGPFVVVTSGHSDAISDWEQSGDALVAIHGPLGTDDEIGTTGAQVSHGCVRLHITDLEQLRPVPPGSPIDIVA